MLTSIHANEVIKSYRANVTSATEPRSTFLLSEPLRTFREGSLLSSPATSANESGLPRTPERLRHRSEPTLGAKTGLVRRSKKHLRSVILLARRVEDAPLHSSPGASPSARRPAVPLRLRNQLSTNSRLA
jgi:hypothetical protein